MKFTDIFVRRPVLALVVSLMILLAGLKAYMGLPVRQYPLLESSVITVSTDYPGAPAELMQGFVTQPIAQAVSSVEGIDYLTSSSVQGSSTVTVRMELNRDSTQALTEVMAKVNQNILISLSLNFIAVALSVAGILTPVTGALLHNCGSVFVVVNAALLLRRRDCPPAADVV